MSAHTCSTVRGNPSRINPLAQSPSLIRSRMIETTSSSLTRPPDSITLLACTPTSVPAATAARSMSPVESCGMESVSTILGACEPLPAPGGPNRIITVLPSAAAASRHTSDVRRAMPPRSGRSSAVSEPRRAAEAERDAERSRRVAPVTPDGIATPTNAVVTARNAAAAMVRRNRRGKK